RARQDSPCYGDPRVATSRPTARYLGARGAIYDPDAKETGTMSTTLTERGRVESCPKRLRVYLGGQLVADTIRAKLVWEVPHYPAYYVPMSDVAREMLVESAREPSASERGRAHYFDV